MTELAAIVLAAGKGTRMKSDLHKVLHPIASRPMLMHLMASVDALSPAKKVVVVGSGKEQLESALAGSAELAVQEPQHGTGHAVQQAQDALAGFDGDVLILYGDVPFVPTATMQAMVERLNAADAPAVVVLAFEPEDPTGYGRVIVEDGRIVKMVEQKDATEAEKAVKLSNSGLMAVKSRDLFGLLDRVTDDNAQKEYYLTDIVNIANADGRVCVAVTTDPFDVAGINSRAQLADMEAEWQKRRRVQAMDDGATLIAPDTVWFAWDTQLGRDVLIEPNVFTTPRISNQARLELLHPITISIDDTRSYTLFSFISAKDDANDTSFRLFSNEFGLCPIVKVTQGAHNGSAPGNTTYLQALLFVEMSDVAGGHGEAIEAAPRS